MEPILFTPLTIKNVTLKNRIVMSPMCMYSCFNKDGKLTPWHITHYLSRAVGQVGLIIVEATAVTPNGRISYEDSGIWSDEHIKPLKQLADLVHAQDAKLGIQIAHAGCKAQLANDIIVAPSAIAFEGYTEPKELSVTEIKELIEAFKLAAKRAKLAGFDVIEIHAAHGYLINEFLSPLSNKRTDEYGGTHENRYRFLREIIDAVKQEWQGPLFVRISANDYVEGGNDTDTYINYSSLMKAQGVDVIDCSSGGVVNAKIELYPGYQVPAAAEIRKRSHIATAAVGLITNPEHAEEILQKGEADLIVLARELLRDPYWPRRAAKELGYKIESPKQYERGWGR